jgi:plastocyanin
MHMPTGEIRTLIAILLMLVWAVSASAAESVNPDAATVYVTDAAGNPVADAVVWFAAEAGIDQIDAASDAVVIDQIDKHFVPSLTVVRTGTEVEFPNSDSVSHHVYSFAQPNSFELPLYRGGETPRIRFDHAGVVTLGCNIHDAMIAYIVVLDATDFAITDKQGVARFARLPAADVAIQIWSPRLNAAKPLPVQRIESANALLTVRAPLRLQPQPDVSEGSLTWEDY